MKQTLSGLALSLALVLVVPFAARAQSANTPRGYVGVFGALASNDAQRPSEEHSNGVWSAQGAVVLWSRLAVGVELARLGGVVSHGGSTRFSFEERQREYALFGAIGVVLPEWGPHRALLSVGVGPLIERRELEALSSGAVTRTRETSPAMLVRAQAHFRVAAHVAIAPEVGVYVLRRPENPNALGRHRASARPFVGIGVVLQ